MLENPGENQTKLSHLRAESALSTRSSQHDSRCNHVQRDKLLARTTQFNTIPFIAINVSMTTQRTPLMDISNNDMTSSPAGAISNRRKSGRAVKIPEKFVPAPSSSQAAPASAKRKRGGEDVENDASDIDEEEEEEEGSEEEIESAAEEEIKEARRKAKSARKPAAKKPKTNGTASHKSASAVRLPSRAKQGAKKGTKILIADREADGLYGMRLS